MEQVVNENLNCFFCIVFGQIATILEGRICQSAAEDQPIFIRFFEVGRNDAGVYCSGMQLSWSVTKKLFDEPYWRNDTIDNLIALDVKSVTWQAGSHGESFLTTQTTGRAVGDISGTLRRVCPRARLCSCRSEVGFRFGRKPQE